MRPKTLMKSLFNRAETKYINFFVRFRKSIGWKKIHGIHLSIREDFISKTVLGYIIRGDYEIEEIKILGTTLHANDILLELGTGLGFNAIYSAKINNNKVVSFEANIDLIPLIKKNMSKNNTHFEVRNEILTSNKLTTANTTFNIVEDFWCSSTKDQLNETIIGKVTVPTRNVKDVIDQYNPTYLFVDIEGGEEEFFNDCSFLQNSSINKILVELHPEVIGEEKCLNILNNITKAGYKMRYDYAPKYLAYFFK